MHSSVCPLFYVFACLPSVRPLWLSKTQNSGSACTRTPYSSHDTSGDCDQTWREGTSEYAAFEILKGFEKPVLLKTQCNSGQFYAVLW